LSDAHFDRRGAQISGGNGWAMLISRSDFQWVGGRFPFWEKPVRADIFVAWRFKNESSSVGAISPEYAAPTELEIVLADVLQICRAYGATAVIIQGVTGFGLGRKNVSLQCGQAIACPANSFGKTMFPPQFGQLILDSAINTG
jgi:hypothetical protein